jgi:hypothetical protein
VFFDWCGLEVGLKWPNSQNFQMAKERQFNESEKGKKADERE